MTVKKQLLGFTVAATLTALFFAVPAFAQDTTTGSGTNGGQSARAGDERNEGGFNPGWLGLLGLAGLAGLRKPAPTVVHRDTNVRP